MQMSTQTHFLHYRKLYSVYKKTPDSRNITVSKSAIGCI